jgi:DNA-binding beta-propeller fold protein YncE
MGPSSVSVGNGVVYIGDRATNEVCSVNAETLELGQCVRLSDSIDGISYVASTHEVWVTTPNTQSLTVLDVAKPGALKAKLVIKTPGAPEGFAIDESRGLFYTNLEDKNETLAIDIKTHTIRSSWKSGCGADGPRGVAVDSARNFVFVACTDSVRILASKRQGAVLGKIETGAGLDNIEYVESTQRLYAAAGRAARLTVAHVDDQGQPSVIATAVTAEGARNAVTDAKGTVYVADSRAARMLIIATVPPISP